MKILNPRTAYGGNAYIVESYRGRDGKPTSRTVEALGRVADLEAADPAWRAKADVRAAALGAEKAASRGLVAYNLAEPSEPSGALNVGWWLADAAWESLGLDAWLGRLRREAVWDQDVAGTLRLLSVSRAMWPGSKRAAVAKAGQLMGAPKVSLATVYKALSHVADVAVKLQTRARRTVAGDGERLECVFYDVTNYFFEIDQADPAGDGHDPARGTAGRRRGCSKEHRVSPIIQMGLFMDREGLPVSYRLFDGSTPDCSTMRGALSEFKEAFGAPHVTVVADAAMNNGGNLAALKADGDDWVFAASIRKEPKRVRAWALEPAGWTHLMGPDGTCSTKVKSKTLTRQIRYKDPDGRERRVEVTEKLIVKWSADYAARDRANRAEMATKAAALVTDPAHFKASGKRGVRKYVKEEQADPATGEVGPAVAVLSLDTAKLQADAALDGYWVLHSSRTSAPNWELLADYRQLWMIEDTFRVSKTDLEARPVYVWSPTHIEAHFTSCFLTLLAMRLTEKATGLSAGRLRQLMGRLVVTEASRGVYLVGRDAGWAAIDEALGIDTDRKWVTIEGLRAWRRQIAAGLQTKLKTLFPT